MKKKSKYVALDCEMVGVGLDGKRSMLARCSIVDFDGEVLLDCFGRYPVAFALLRSSVRIIHGHVVLIASCSQREGDRFPDTIQWHSALVSSRWLLYILHNSVLTVSAAVPFEEVQQRAADILKGRILVGHALNNDLRVSRSNARQNMSPPLHLCIYFFLTAGFAADALQEEDARHVQVQAVQGGGVLSAMAACDKHDCPLAFTLLPFLTFCPEQRTNAGAAKAVGKAPW